MAQGNRFSERFSLVVRLGTRCGDRGNQPYAVRGMKGVFTWSGLAGANALQER